MTILIESIDNGWIVSVSNKETGETKTLYCEQFNEALETMQNMVV